MSFTPVIPSTWNSDRRTLMAALQAIVDAFIVAPAINYTIGRKFRGALPDTFTAEGPLIVIGDVTERIVHTGSIRQTVFSGSLYYVDWVTDREEVADRVDKWADYMRDLFTENRRTVSSTGELVQVGFEEGQFAQGQLVFAAPSITFAYTVQGGYR